MRCIFRFLLLACALPVFADITISTVTPAAGLISGGAIVHLHGTNLLGAPLACPAPQCSVYVEFGDTLGNVIYNSADEIVVIAPPRAAGAVDLIVNVPVNPQLTLKNAFSYQDPKSDTVRLLLPIAAGTQGLLNSNWQTDVLAHNETTSPVVIAGTTIPPISTRRLTLSPASTGMFLQIPRSAVEGVTITTHVHDTTHDAESLGVDVPSVPETQFRRSVSLTGVPNDSRYRVLLRVYGYPGNHSAIVRVRDDSTDALLSTQILPLTGTDVAYLQTPISGAPASIVLRVEVTASQSNEPPIWAFLTLTNNTTESVTTITPSVAIAPESTSTVLASGHWRHAGNCAEVDFAGHVQVTYGGCAFGTVTLQDIGTDGHFEADGSLTHGGACCQPPESAHFSGLVSNGTLTMTIRTATQTLGPFTLIEGSTEQCGPFCP
ncbi:MAG TPA: IPT/TIG domain-containing protein [Thermoanaerobaculia bacterium]|jgi:hypothetical protein|nr:IPT/TIG domain-containing protein [Thermoanaerobaculia bacterium]